MREHIAVRLKYNDEILPGRFIQDTSKVKSVSLVNGPFKVNEDPTSAVEFLAVSDVCSVAWVPYNAGDQMPSKAVIGWRKRNGKPLLVASLWMKNAEMESKYLYGYYDPESRLGYTVKSEPESNSGVDMMVEF